MRSRCTKKWNLMDENLTSGLFQNSQRTRTIYVSTFFFKQSCLIKFFTYVAINAMKSRNYDHKISLLLLLVCIICKSHLLQVSRSFNAVLICQIYFENIQNNNMCLDISYNTCSWGPAKYWNILFLWTWYTWIMTSRFWMSVICVSMMKFIYRFQ